MILRLRSLRKLWADQECTGTFLSRSENWKNLIDPETHWIQTAEVRMDRGRQDSIRRLAFRTLFSMWGQSRRQIGFEEGNTYQYSFMVPFDYPALFAAMGGEKAVEPRLDHFFDGLAVLGQALLQHRE